MTPPPQGFDPCSICGTIPSAEAKPRLKWNSGNPIWLCTGRIPVAPEDEQGCEPEDDGLTECCHLLRPATDEELYAQLGPMVRADGSIVSTPPAATDGPPQL